jgi:hypothetical protein
METQFICTECGCEHDDPADAALGHRVLCLDCALTIEATASFKAAAARKPIAPPERCDGPPLAA